MRIFMANFRGKPDRLKNCYASVDIDGLLKTLRSEGLMHCALRLTAVQLERVSDCIIAFLKDLEKQNLRITNPYTLAPEAT